MRVGIDFDGIICDFNGEFINRAQKEFNLEIDSDDMDYSLETIEEKYGISSSWVNKKLFKDEWFWAKLMPYEETLETLREWNNLGHEIHIITGRPKDTAIVTRGWLRKHQVPHTALTFEPIMHKIDYIKRLEIEVMFEDRFFEANKIGAFGIRSFIVRRPWNVHYESRVTNPLVTFVDALSEVNNLIGGIYA